mgnify:CR=1 FL=1
MLQPGHNGNDHGAALGVFEQVAADSGLDRAAELTSLIAWANADLSKKEVVGTERSRSHVCPRCGEMMVCYKGMWICPDCGTL